MTSLRIQLSTEVYKSWEQEHLAARQKIAKALVELATAVQDEGQLAEKMAAAGALDQCAMGRPFVGQHVDLPPGSGRLSGIERRRVLPQQREPVETVNNEPRPARFAPGGGFQKGKER